MYGMPQPNQYGSYGFGNWPAGGGTPGMPTPQGGDASGAQVDPNAAAAAGQVGQAQWGSDPNSYYNNYWGGKCNLTFCLMVCVKPIEFAAGYYGQQAGQGAAGAQQPQGGS
jgi:hypothetical protein